MEIKHKSADQCEIFYLKGNIGMDTEKVLTSNVLDILENMHSPKVVLHMKDVDFVDSSGLGLLMNLQSKLKNKAKFRFCQVKENIKMAIEYTNLTHFFKIDDTEEESVQALNRETDGV